MVGVIYQVEQYDEHIALYVSDTLVRARFRHPHYMYEENWFFMRKLSDAVQFDVTSEFGQLSGASSDGCQSIDTLRNVYVLRDFCCNGVCNTG